MYVYQVCFSMYRSYHICRRLWIWSEVAPGCQGITLQILSRLRQSYPNGPKELKRGILQQKYVFWHLRTLQSSFACFTASPGKYGEAAALLQGLQSSQLALAIGLALWNGLSCRRPHPTSWGHRACGLCPRLTVLRFPLIPSHSYIQFSPVQFVLQDPYFDLKAHAVDGTCAFACHDKLRLLQFPLWLPDTIADVDEAVVRSCT